MANPRQYKIPDWFLNRQKDIKDGKFSQVRLAKLYAMLATGIKFCLCRLHLTCLRTSFVKILRDLRKSVLIVVYVTTGGILFLSLLRKNACVIFLHLNSSHFVKLLLMYILFLASVFAVNTPKLLVVVDALSVYRRRSKFRPVLMEECISVEYCLQKWPINSWNPKL